jgi:hypothetical protein
MKVWGVFHYDYEGTFLVSLHFKEVDARARADKENLEARPMTRNFDIDEVEVE